MVPASQPEADSMLAVVTQAAGQLGTEEVSALSDPRFRDQAARWRSGSESRRISAAFARLINSLHMIRPGWLKPAPVRAPDEPPVTDAIPMNSDRTTQASAGSAAWNLSWFMKGAELCAGWCMAHWRTLMVALLCLAFPRLVALLVAALIRMVIRACAAVVFRVIQEVWNEFKVGVQQISLASTSIEQMLLDQLEGLLMDSTSSQLPISMNPSPLPAQFRGNPPPSPPWAFFSTLLLLLLVALQLLPYIRTGGAGSDQNSRGDVQNDSH